MKCTLCGDTERTNPSLKFFFYCPNCHSFLCSECYFVIYRREEMYCPFCKTVRMVKKEVKI